MTMPAPADRSAGAGIVLRRVRLLARVAGALLARRAAGIAVLVPARHAAGVAHPGLVGAVGRPRDARLARGVAAGVHALAGLVRLPGRGVAHLRGIGRVALRRRARGILTHRPLHPAIPRRVLLGARTVVPAAVAVDAGDPALHVRGILRDPRVRDHVAGPLHAAIALGVLGGGGVHLVAPHRVGL